MQVKLDTGFNIEVEFPISPFARRMFAWVIDVVVISSYLWIGSKLLNYLFPEQWPDHDWVYVLFGLPVIVYHPVCEITMNGQSIGKKAMAIKVIAADGGQPTISQYLIRWAFRIIDFPGWIFGAIATGALPWWCSIFIFGGIGSVIITSKSQRLGDLVAGTIIIDTQTRTSWEDTVFTELESNYQPRFPEVMRLSDKDINTLKSIIERVRKKGDYDLSMRIAERIKMKLTIASDQDSFDFLETLLKDYNYYSTK
ncbi:MAG TPA: RDD family protein [Puia sp.]|nr:RDD family protein [Puia sp.]